MIVVTASFKISAKGVTSTNAFGFRGEFYREAGTYRVGVEASNITYSESIIR